MNIVDVDVDVDVDDVGKDADEDDDCVVDCLSRLVGAVTAVTAGTVPLRTENVTGAVAVVG